MGAEVAQPGPDREHIEPARLPGGGVHAVYAKQGAAMAAPSVAACRQRQVLERSQLELALQQPGERQPDALGMQSRVHAPFSRPEQDRLVRRHHRKPPTSSVAALASEEAVTGGSSVSRIWPPARTSDRTSFRSYASSRRPGRIVIARVRSNPRTRSAAAISGAM